MRRAFFAAPFLALGLVACAASEQTASAGEGFTTPTQDSTVTEPHPFVGMWVTADGHIRQDLLPGGRYDEARGNRLSAYSGSYTVVGNHIDYVDDSGFTADGMFDGDVLHHGGYIFYREGSPSHLQARQQG